MKKLLFPLSLILLLACKPVRTPVSLENRILQFWKIRNSGNYTLQINGGATSFYENFLSEVSKKQFNEAKFYSRFKKKIINPVILNIEYNKERTSALVTYKSDINAQGLTFRNVKRNFNWVFENNQWKLKLKEITNPFIKVNSTKINSTINKE